MQVGGHHVMIYYLAGFRRVCATVRFPFHVWLANFLNPSESACSEWYTHTKGPAAFGVVTQLALRSAPLVASRLQPGTSTRHLSCSRGLQVQARRYGRDPWHTCSHRHIASLCMLSISRLQPGHAGASKEVQNRPPA